MCKHYSNKFKKFMISYNANRLKNTQKRKYLPTYKIYVPMCL